MLPQIDTVKREPRILDRWCSMVAIYATIIPYYPLNTIILNISKYVSQKAAD
jgi:hypothetical protein